tara:strand:+ start:2547 stop:2759 length:213 start_codon:yes stop_codon:yes gene_type:complete
MDKTEIRRCLAAARPMTNIEVFQEECEQLCDAEVFAAYDKEMSVLDPYVVPEAYSAAFARSALREDGVVL